MKSLFGRKVNDLAELKGLTENAIQKGQVGSPYTVIREVTLSGSEFQTFADDFFSDQPWIKEGEGGTNPNGEIQCIRVVSRESGETVLVNPEGNSYPRYTGLEIEEATDQHAGSGEGRDR